MSKYAYSYSSAFDGLKNIHEALDSNYSTRDYVGAMETLLFNSVKPLVTTSRFSDTFIAGVASWYSSNAKRRISRLDKAEFFGLVAQMLATDDTEVKFAKLQQMQLERTILFFMVDLWLQSMNGYTRTVNQYAKTKSRSLRENIDSYEYKVGKRKNPTVSLYSAVRESKFWLSQFLTLKEMILQKYSRMVISCAQKDYKSIGHKVTLNDLVQNYMVTAARALDKCDYKQGTLTSYIQLWLKNAKSRSLRVDSIDSGYDVAQSHTTQVQYFDDGESDTGSTLETSVEDTTEANDHIDNVRKLIKLIDPVGVFRLMSGIEESLSLEEKRILNSS